jgi:hypothetical protein
MRNRQIKQLSVDAAVRWNRRRRPGEGQSIAMPGRRVLYLRSNLQDRLEAEEHLHGRSARVERLGSLDMRASHKASAEPVA